MTINSHEKNIRHNNLRLDILRFLYYDKKHNSKRSTSYKVENMVQQFLPSYLK